MAPAKKKAGKKLAVKAVEEAKKAAPAKSPDPKAQPKAVPQKATPSKVSKLPSRKIEHYELTKADLDLASWVNGLPPAPPAVNGDQQARVDLWWRTWVIGQTQSTAERQEAFVAAGFKATPQEYNAKYAPTHRWNAFCSRFGKEDLLRRARTAAKAGVITPTLVSQGYGKTPSGATGPAPSRVGDPGTLTRDQRINEALLTLALAVGSSNDMSTRRHVRRSLELMLQDLQDAL